MMAHYISTYMISSGRLPKSHVQVQSLWKMFKLPEQGISWV